MFVAHLPLGYAVNRAMGARGKALRAGLIGSVAPDLDLLYFYLLSDRRTPHHAYFPHWPIVWLPLLLIAFAFRVCRKSELTLGFLLFTLFSIPPPAELPGLSHSPPKAPCSSKSRHASIPGG